VALATIHKQTFLLIRYCGNQLARNESAQKNILCRQRQMLYEELTALHSG